ncbi:MAG TPA: sulfatase-like hydrolase/transferase [Terriglobales bacterium]|nr:sulfatase-like hydrolase/transferase [Terriglobales bacterium]
MRVLRRVWVVFLWVLCAAAQSSKPAVKTRAPSKRIDPNIILITLDTTRADRMGFLGSERGLTLNLDELAKQGVVFTRAYSHVPLTPPSHATILTGTYPQFNHVDDFGSTLGPDVPYLPDILHHRGYQTAAFVSSIILDPVQGSGRGFDRGFDVYNAGFHFRRPGDDRYEAIERRAGEVVARAEAWLDKHPRGPFFLWLHFYDAHDPYDPPEPFKAKYASAPYDGEIAYVDSQLGKFLTELKAKGRFDNTMIAVMADHGEALGDHGETAHGVFLYDETIHVPLLIKLPGARDAGKRVESRTGLVDVAPTVLQTAGLVPAKEMQGTSLLSEMATGAAGRDRPAFAETDYPRKAFGWSSLRAWRTGKYLLIEAPRKELYDQSTDPKATQNLATSSTAVADTLTSQIDAFRAKTSSMGSGEKGPVDPEAQEKLAALGYVATDNDIKVGPGIPDTHADPKDKVEIVNLLHDAILDAEETRFEDAIPLLKQVLAKEPGIPVAYTQLGAAYTWTKQYQEAIPVLRKALELRSDGLMTHYELALSLSEMGDWTGALPHFEEASKKSPKWAALHFSLAAAYARLDRAGDARRELETTLKLEPDNYRANLVLGRMLTLDGKLAEALPRLKKAVKADPKSPDAHRFLADAYGRMGQIDIARKEAAEAERLKQESSP